MPHYLDENIAVLRRWAAITDQPLPEDWRKFASDNLDAATAVELQDPELALLLSGKAPASLKADALSGKLPHVAPDQEKLARQAFDQLVADTRDRVKSGEANFTERVWLEANDPQAAKPPETMPTFTGPLAEGRRRDWIYEQQLAAAGSQG